MFIKRNGEKNDCVVAGMVINDMRTKEFEDKTFYEIPVSMGKDAEIINVTVWNRKPEEIKKFDHVLACGQLKVQKVDKDGETKTYYTLNADFIVKENCVKAQEKTQPELEPIDDDSLPF